MKKYILITTTALFCVLADPACSQGFTVIDTVKHEGKMFQVLSVPLEALNIDPKKDNYPSLVIKAKKMDLHLCPRDSVFLSRVSKKVVLDPTHQKYEVFIASTPYAGEAPGGENEFFIPTIVARDEQEVEFYYGRVGLFLPEEFPNPFTVFYEINKLGHYSFDTGFTAYDWIFLRPITGS